MLPLLMLIDLRVLPAYWRKWHWRDSAILILGSIPGILIGAYVFASADADLIRVMIGAVSLLFVIWQLAKDRLDLDRKFSETVGIACGVAVGFTSYIAHAGGPPAAMYLLGRDLGKTQYQASTVLVFWVVNMLKVGFYAAIGVFTVNTLLLDLIMAPVALVGAWIGIRLHHRISERLFFGLTYCLLTVTGVKLVWDGVL